MNKMSDVKRRLITSMIAIVLLIITIVGITYAFFTSQVKGNTNTKSAEAKAGRLQLKYADGNGLIELYKIQPGVILETKTFTVTNTGTGLIENYDVIMENVMNELEHYEDLTYTLTCTSTSGSCVGSYGVFPTQESIIATNTIDVGVKHTYQLTVEYNETNLDQSIDMNKTVFAKVNIQDSNDNDQSSNLIIYGNTIYDQNSTPNNPTSLSSVGEIVKASSLPTGYDELEYIESTGTQYIDTGVYMNYSKKIYVDFKLNTLQSQTRIFGADFDASSGVTGFSTSLYRNGSGIFSYSYQDDTGNWIQTGIKTDLKRHTFLIDGINKIANLDDGVYEGSLASYSATKTATKTLTIFADNRPINSTPINYYASMRLYSFKIWNNGELIRDFVPAKNSSNVVGLYDKIGNNFYVSPNNESFIAGPITYIYNLPITVNGTNYNITLKEPLRKVDNYVDYIDFKNRKVVRNVAYVELPFSTLAGTTYPSWKNIPETFRLESYYPNVNGNLKTKTSLITNIEGTSWNAGINTNTGNNILVILNSGLTAAELAATYPNFMFQMNYGVPSDEVESITLPNINLKIDNNVVTVNTTVQPSRITYN